VNVGARATSLQFKIPLEAQEIKSIANRLQIFQKKADQLRKQLSGLNILLLLHQQHLARAFDGVCQATLIMRRHSGVFAGQNAALVGHVLPEQVRVLEIQRILREINFWFRARRAVFRRAARPALVFFGVRFAGHNYLISLCKV
jgi:hypothetical protein